MKKSSLLFASALLLAFVGCVSEERLADYEAWKVSEDGAPNVEFADFESQYKEGWQARAAEKKAARLAREKAERKERERLEAERIAKEDADCNARRAEAEKRKNERLASAQKTRDDEIRLESERLEAELVAAEQPIFEEYRCRINLYWDAKARESYQTALAGQFKDLSRFIEITDGGANSLIESFAEEKMPNANGAYEKTKERAMELQQIYNEEFSTPEKPGSDKYSVYCALLEQLAKARMAYIRAYQELAHYYFDYKFGVVTQDELAKIDESPIVIPFLDSEPRELPICKDLGTKESEFGLKYMPESYEIYRQYRKEFAEITDLLREASSERVAANVSRGPVFQAAFSKAVDLRDHINRMTSEYIELYMKHRLGEKNSDDLEQIDARRASKEKSFVDNLPTRVRKDTEVADTRFLNDIRNEMRNAIRKQSANRRSGINDRFERAEREIESEKNNTYQKIALERFLIDLPLEMVSIPGRKFKMQKTEVTQRQWQAIMGNNPSYFKGDNRPVEQVSWNDAQEFIKRLNQKSQEAGLKVRYRLPTEQEWEYCCRAGSKGDWGKRANGQEGPLDVMGWYDRNSGNETHPVAKKEPNDWGLYDMHGNVWEWTSTADSNFYVHRGGSWRSYGGNSCRAGCRNSDHPDYRGYGYYNLGFRLIAEDL